MENRLKRKRARSSARAARVRRKVRGSAERPRVSARFTNRNIIAQLIDDDMGRSLLYVSTFGAEAPARGKGVDSARAVGERIAEGARSLGVEALVFDRGSRLYHGRVRAMAEAIREKGLKL